MTFALFFVINIYIYSSSICLMCPSALIIYYKLPTFLQHIHYFKVYFAHSKHQEIAEWDKDIGLFYSLDCVMALDDSEYYRHYKWELNGYAETGKWKEVHHEVTTLQSGFLSHGTKWIVISVCFQGMDIIML